MADEPDARRPEKSPPNYEAAAVYGVEIDWDRLYRTERTRTCRCVADPPAEWRYCPGCGHAVWEERRVAIPEWDSSDPGRPLLAGLTVVTTTVPSEPALSLTPLGRQVIRSGVRLFAGVLARTDLGTLARRTEFDPVRDKAHVRERLEPLGLWDDARFGLWAILHRIG